MVSMAEFYLLFCNSQIFGFQSHRCHQFLRMYHHQSGPFPTFQGHLLARKTAPSRMRAPQTGHPINRYGSQLVTYGVRSCIIIFLKSVKNNINIKCNNERPDPCFLSDLALVLFSVSQFDFKKYDIKRPDPAIFGSIIVAISTTLDHPANRREINPEVFRDLLILMRTSHAFCLIFPSRCLFDICEDNRIDNYKGKSTRSQKARPSSSVAWKKSNAFLVYFQSHYPGMRLARCGLRYARD